MGEVYLVEDTELNRNIALKVIGGPALSDDLSSRLLKEAKIVARLEHPSIVPVHDAGKLLDGRTFFTMKYVQGQNLEKYARPEIALSDLLRTFHKVCQAVAFAHSRGVIHRDLKPENIMVWPDVARAAEQIDPVVNTNQLPPPINPLTCPARHAFFDKTSTLWIQGVTLGLDWRF